MKPSTIALAVGAVAVLGFGLWLGKSSSSSPDTIGSASPPAQQPQPASPPPPPSPRPASVPPSPTLARPTPAAPPSAGLAADLRDRDPKVRRAALKEAIADQELDPAVLLAASRDPDLEVGVVATEALHKRYAEGAVPIAEMIARATDRSLHERVRTSALNGLGLVAHPQAAATLVRLLQSGDVLERRSAAILLVHQDPALAVPALIDALADADEGVRGNAHESLKARSRGRDFGSDAAAWRQWWQARSR